MLDAVALCAAVSQQEKPLMHDHAADHRADLCISWHMLLLVVAGLRQAVAAAHARNSLRERLLCWQRSLCRPSLHGALSSLLIRSWQQSWLCGQVGQLSGGGQGGLLRPRGLGGCLG